MGILDDNCVISLNSVTIGYQKGKPLIEGLDLQVNSGEVIAIVGPSGIGKTTLLRTIAGLVPPLSGSLEVCNQTSPASPPRGKLGYIPQRLGLVRHASVHHNVMLGALAGHCTNWLPFSFDARKSAREAIQKMGLEEKRRSLVRRLSGGQQRRVATARTLAQKPSIILADEFLGELDEETMLIVMEAVISYVNSENAALIVVEHDIQRAQKMADRLLLMKNGRLVPYVESSELKEEES